MIILRRDQLNLVEPTHEAMKTPPAPYDFEKEKESAVNVAKVLISRMKELGGVGLSANQLGLNLRVFVMGDENNYLAVFNPEILETKGDPFSFREGCLSYPGLMMNITRPPIVRVKFQNEYGVWKEEEYIGITARIFQHEYDHMEGKDFTSKVSKMKLDFAMKKYKNVKKKIIKKHAVKTMIEALNESTKSERV